MKLYSEDFAAEVSELGVVIALLSGTHHRVSGGSDHLAKELFAPCLEPSVPGDFLP
jgi:hypothetical protein